MQIISTDNAPKAIGPYSQAIKKSDMLFLSGQIALDPKTGELVSQKIEDQARKAIENLKAVLKEAGCTVENVVKTTIFLKNIDDFVKVNEIYAETFDKFKPARSTVEVSALPKGALFEIDCIAII